MHINKKNHIHRPVLSDQLSSSFQLRTSSKQVKWVRCYEEVLCSPNVCALIILWLIDADTWLGFAITNQCCHLGLMDYNVKIPHYM